MQAPLLAEEKSQGADVGVLLVADVGLAECLVREVVHHGQGGARRALVVVLVLEAPGALQVKTRGQAVEKDLGNGVAAANGVLQDPEIAAALDGLGDLGAVGVIKVI